MAERISLGLVGARGYVGAELIRLVAAHPRFELAFVSSSERDGQRLADHEPAYAGELRYSNLGPDAVAGQGVLLKMSVGTPSAATAAKWASRTTRPIVTAIPSQMPARAISVRTSGLRNSVGPGCSAWRGGVSDAGLTADMGVPD